MEVVVYSTGPSCMQCKQTMREMDKRGIPYRVVNLHEDDEAASRVKGLGFNQAPVVEAGDDMWGGFRIDKIRQLAA